MGADSRFHANDGSAIARCDRGGRERGMMLAVLAMVARRILEGFGMAIQPGVMAPDFTLMSHSGEPVTLSDYRGAAVVLAFHPASFTGG